MKRVMLFLLLAPWVLLGQTITTDPASYTIAPPANTIATAPVSADATRAVVPSVPMPTEGLDVAGSGATTEVSSATTTQSATLMPTQDWQRAENIDYRKIESIRWPPLFLGNDEIREKYQSSWGTRDPEEFKKIFNEYCLLYARLYQVEMEKQWQLSAGTLRLEKICEGLKTVADNAGAQDSFLFDYPNPLVIKKMDQAAYQYYISPLYKSAEAKPNIDTALAAEMEVSGSPESAEAFSFLEMLGIPRSALGLVIELLLIFSLIVSGYLLYRVIKK